VPGCRRNGLQAQKRGKETAAKRAEKPKNPLSEETQPKVRRFSAACLAPAAFRDFHQKL